MRTFLQVFFAVGSAWACLASCGKSTNIDDKYLGTYTWNMSKTVFGLVESDDEENKYAIVIKSSRIEIYFNSFLDRSFVIESARETNNGFMVSTKSSASWGQLYILEDYVNCGFYPFLDGQNYFYKVP